MIVTPCLRGGVIVIRYQIMHVMPDVVRRTALLVLAIRLRRAPDRLERQGEQQQHGQESTHGQSVSTSQTAPSEISCPLDLATVTYPLALPRPSP